ncbi:MAG TPA: carbon-nitrogen hydrolase family protein [Nevskiaceae bacterium]|nr:carbon-nitrogen hydrolase family protein [Nevskiaceae bacterium]
MKAAVLQMNSGDDLAANLAQAQSLLEQAQAQGCKLAVLPENFAFMGAHERDKLRHAESAGGGAIQDFLSRAAARLRLWIVGGTAPLAVAHTPDKVYAASLVYDDRGACVARYDKIHLFDVQVPTAGGAQNYRESASIEAGVPRAQTIATPAGILGLSVCYDLRFPELYRALSALGVEVFAVPSAFTAATGAAHWSALLRARAIENQAYVLAPGQCGTHPGGRQTWGHSLIVDPWGIVLCELGDAPGIGVAELDFERLAQVRTTFPALRHRRLSS